MTTFRDEIKAADIRPFDGTPADLDVFDNSIKLSLVLQNLPLYYGGYVVGEKDRDYEYVAPGTRNSKPNYRMGRRLCAALAAKLEGMATCWWREYDRKDENPFPNCWKPNAMKRGALGSGTMNEVSLYLLLKEQFSGEVDARTAEIELGKFQWEPFKQDGLSVMAFLSGSGLGEAGRGQGEEVTDETVRPGLHSNSGEAWEMIILKKVQARKRQVVA